MHTKKSNTLCNAYLLLLGGKVGLASQKGLKRTFTEYNVGLFLIIGRNTSMGRHVTDFLCVSCVSCLGSEGCGAAGCL